MIVSVTPPQDERSSAPDTADQDMRLAGPAAVSRRDRLIGLVAEILVGAVLAMVSAWSAVERVVFPRRSATDRNE
jgi:hypothetical protein